MSLKSFVLLCTHIPIGLSKFIWKHFCLLFSGAEGKFNDLRKRRQSLLQKRDELKVAQPPKEVIGKKSPKIMLQLTITAYVSSFS